MGAKADYFATSKSLSKEADLGLFNFTKKESDKHHFKVPTLRNIAQTSPYFHDGSAATLEEAVSVMAKVQLGKKMSENEVSDISSFLRTLTGEYEGRLLR